jgi:hypothetical protein
MDRIKNKNDISAASAKIALSSFEARPEVAVHQIGSVTQRKGDSVK